MLPHLLQAGYLHDNTTEGRHSITHLLQARALHNHRYVVPHVRCPQQRHPAAGWNPRYPGDARSYRLAVSVVLLLVAIQLF